MEEPPMEQEVTTGKISRGPSPAPDTEAAMLNPEDKNVRVWYKYNITCVSYNLSTTGVREGPF